MTWSATSSSLPRTRFRSKCTIRPFKRLPRPRRPWRARTASVAEAQQNVTVAEAAIQQARARISQADASIQAALTAPQQIAVSQSRGQIRGGKSRAAESAAGSSPAQPQLLHDRRAGERDRGQEDRGDRPERFAGTATAGGGSAGRHLGDREFQGNATQKDEAGPEGEVQRGRLRSRIHRSRHRHWRAPPARASACFRRKMQPATT